MDKRPFFSHHRLGLRCNPFGALTAAEWAESGFLPDRVKTAVWETNSHLQLLGPMGCGKTATLHRLHHLLHPTVSNSQYEYIPEGQRRFNTPLTVDLQLFLLDEAQRLSWRSRREWLRWLQTAGARCFFSAHDDLAAQFAAKGLPIVSIFLPELIDLAYYQAWIAGRLEAFRLPQRPFVSMDEEAVQLLYQTFGVNLREAEYFLYELFQMITDPQPITAVLLHKQLDLNSS